jgi:hypothetical protein
VKKGVLKTIVSAVASCAAGLSQPLVPCVSPPIPIEVQSHLRSNFPSLRVKQSTDLTLAQGLWKRNRPLDSNQPLQCPGIVVGRFEPGTAAVYVFLLVPNDRPNSGFKLVAVRPQLGGAGVTSVVIEDQESAGAADWFLRPVQLNKVFDQEFVRGLRVREGFMFAQPNGAWGYFWDAGRYKHEFIDL